MEENKERTPDALEQRLKNAVMAVAKAAFPEENIKDFTLIIQRDAREAHGDYMNQRIRIANLERRPEQVLATALHELAHHIEYAYFGSVSHSKEFYRIYHKLLTTACKMGIFTPDMLGNGFEDEESVRQAVKHFGKITASPEENMLYKKDYCLVTAEKSYKQRDILRERKYIYNSRAKTWEKQMLISEAEKEAEYLTSIGAEPFITGLLDITVLATVTVKGSTYGRKKKLTERGYRFDSKKTAWIKTVKNGDLEEELSALSEITKGSELIKVSVEF